jgi:hypothetical protein
VVRLRQKLDKMRFARRYYPFAFPLRSDFRFDFVSQFSRLAVNPFFVSAFSFHSRSLVSRTLNLFPFNLF